MLRYVMLCYVMLCYVMLCYVTLRYVTLCYVRPRLKLLPLLKHLWESHQHNFLSLVFSGLGKTLERRKEEEKGSPKTQPAVKNI